MSRDLVLVITSRDEISVPPVLAHLEEMRQPFFRLDADALIADHIVLSMNLRGSDFAGYLRQPNGDAISTDRLKSVWFRRPKAVATDGLYLESEQAAFAEAEVSAALWSLYTSLEHVYWMNHPLQSRYLFEHNKLLQMKLAATCGLRVPETIVSNDPAQIISFCEKHGGVVAVKVIKKSALINVGQRGSWIYTNVLTLEYLLKHADNISSATLMAQEYVPKKTELRITAVGPRLFTCAIHSQDSERTKVDWRRYDFEKVKHEAYKLPNEIEAKLIKFMESCDLSFGAIDMIVTPDDDFVFLEVNPSGQFGWIERLAGLPISRSIAEALACPPTKTRRTFRKTPGSEVQQVLAADVPTSASLGRAAAEAGR